MDRLQAHIEHSDAIIRPGMEPDELMQEYATREMTDVTYEMRALDGFYTAPRHTAERMAKMVEPINRADYKLLDVGAGTGLVGQELKKLGFHNISSLDPSDALSKEAKIKNVYTMFYKSFMTEQETKCLQKNQFDGLITAACFAENHLPVGVLDEMTRVVKPGGVIVIEMRLAYLTSVVRYNDKLEPYMKELEALGKWKLVSREIFKHHFADDEGVVWVFVVC